jgi:hypothetical protein
MHNTLIVPQGKRSPQPPRKLYLGDVAIEVGKPAPRPMYSAKGASWGWSAVGKTGFGIVTHRSACGASAVVVYILPTHEARLMADRKNQLYFCPLCGDRSGYCACDVATLGKSTSDNLFEHGYRLEKAYVPNALRVSCCGAPLYLLHNIHEDATCSCTSFAVRKTCKHVQGWKLLRDRQLNHGQGDITFLLATLPETNPDIVEEDFVDPDEMRAMAAHFASVETFAEEFSIDTAREMIEREAWI